MGITEQKLAISNKNTPPKSHLLKKPLGGRSGQGVIEYILLLVIALLIVLGVVYQFNDAFRVWANNYFGEYLACLLETGELPTIGGSGGSLSSCNSQFKEFSLADGRPYLTSMGSGGGNGGSNNGSGQGQNPNNNKNSALSEDQNKQSNYVGANSSKSGGGSSTFGSNQNSDPFGGKGSQNNNAGAASKKKKYTGSLEDSTPQSVLNKNSTGTSSRQGDLDGRFSFQQNNPIENEGTRPLLKTNLIPQEKKRGIIPVNKTKLKKEDLPPDEPMTVGNFFRILIIVALIITLIIVVGSQLLKISKEMD
ncbi:MAG: hypothetical protein K1X29_04595 [Bdellovibrionales bacterium]|nr:hypothetical protein [Bdellovibrionales bacterium]